jgi:hypothetical protein
MYSVYTCCYFINLEFLILSVRDVGRAVAYNAGGPGIKLETLNFSEIKHALLLQKQTKLQC